MVRMMTGWASCAVVSLACAVVSLAAMCLVLWCRLPHMPGQQDEMESDDDGAQCDEPQRGGTASQDEAVLSAHGAAPPVGMPKDKLHDPTRNGGVCDCYFW